MTSPTSLAGFAYKNLGTSLATTVTQGSTHLPIEGLTVCWMIAFHYLRSLSCSKILRLAAGRLQVLKRGHETYVNVYADRGERRQRHGDRSIRTASLLKSASLLKLSSSSMSAQHQRLDRQQQRLNPQQERVYQTGGVDHMECHALKRADLA